MIGWDISDNGEREIGELIAKAMEKVGKEGVITISISFYLIDQCLLPVLLVEETVVQIPSWLWSSRMESFLFLPFILLILIEV